VLSVRSDLFERRAGRVFASQTLFYFYFLDRGTFLGETRSWCLVSVQEVLAGSVDGRPWGLCRRAWQAWPDKPAEERIGKIGTSGMS